MRYGTPQVTESGLKVLKLMLVRPNESLSGSEISKITNLGSGTIYPILFEFERNGWLTSSWEDILGERPRRRIYKMAVDSSDAQKVIAAHSLGMRAAGDLPVSTTPAGMQSARNCYQWWTNGTHNM